MNSLVFLLYTIFVTFVSLRPMEGGSLENWDKVGHLVLYFIFAILGRHVVTNTRHYSYVCIAIVIYGGLMEVAQSFMPGRMMSIYDVIANAAGVALAILFSRLILSRKA